MASAFRSSRGDDSMRRSTALVASLVVSVSALAASLPTLQAQTSGERIGQVSFPTSCAAAVQKPFERAVALLHSFWYIEAAKAFTAVAPSDPGCPIAHWGPAVRPGTQSWAPPPPAALKRALDAADK